MAEFFKNATRNKLIMGIVSVVLGILLIAFRSGAVAGLIRIVGYVLLIGAVVYFVSYFAGKAKKGTASAIASGIICAVLGLICVISPNWLIALFPIFMGIALIVSGIFNLSMLLNTPVKTGGILFSIVIAVLTLVFGILAIVNPMGTADVLLLFIGITFLINGIGDLTTVAQSGK